ncbi:MAG: hypothetical protein ACJ8F7_22120 [Gemmataceae bacterium]
MPRYRLLLSLLPALTLAAPLPAQPLRSAETPQFRTRTASSLSATQVIPYESLSPQIRERVRGVVNRPTLVTHAEPVEFRAEPKTYEWLLDHPDRASLAYRRLGVECTPITDRGNGKFGWADDQGSDVVWYTVATGPTARVWYAEGQVRAGAVLPLIPVRVVVVLRHDYLNESTPAAKVRHQVDVFAHADSRAASIVARLFGGATDRVAEQSAEQLLLFFSMLSKYVAEHPEKQERVLAPAQTVSR